MLDVSRVIPSVVIRSILVVASLILIMQIGLFTWFAISDCSKEPPIEEIGTAEELQAVLWCVYEGKIIKILPTAAIFAIIIGFGFQLVVVYGRSVFRDSPTTGDFITLFKGHKWRRLARELYHTALLLLVTVFVALEFSSLSPYIPNAILVLLLTGLFWHFVMTAWTDWFVRWVARR